MSSYRELLDWWPGRWRLMEARGSSPADAVLDTLANERSPKDAIAELIAGGHYSAADLLLTDRLEPPLSLADASDLTRLLDEARDATVQQVQERLDQLDARAQLAGGAPRVNREVIIEHAELDASEAFDEVERTAGVKTTTLEQAREHDLRTRLEGHPARARRWRDRVVACIEARAWEAAGRLLDEGPARVPLAVPDPTDIAALPALGGHAPLSLIDSLLAQPEGVAKRHGWPIPDEQTLELLSALADDEPSPERVAVAFDRMLGGSGTRRERDAVRLDATEHLPVPRPRFVPADGLVVATGHTAAPGTITLRLRGGVAPPAPCMDIRDLLTIALAEDRKVIALLRVLGPKLHAALVLPDLRVVPDLERALAWAFTLAGHRVRAPLVDLVINCASARPALVEVLFTALVTKPVRGGYLDEDDLQRALDDGDARSSLADALREDLSGNETALSVLLAVAEVLGEDPTVDAEETQLAVELLSDARGELNVPDAAAIGAAIQQLEVCGYVRHGSDGARVYRLGAVRTVRPVLRAQLRLEAGPDQP